MSLEFRFYKYGGKCESSKEECSDILKIMAANIHSEGKSVSCKKEPQYCAVTYKCYNCELTRTGTFTLKMVEDESYATDIYVSISSSSSIPGEKSTLTTIVTASSIDKYFRGSDPTTINLLTTPSLFLTNLDDWNSELKGYHISQLVDPHEGSEVEYSE